MVERQQWSGPPVGRETRMRGTRRPSRSPRSEWALVITVRAHVIRDTGRDGALRAAAAAWRRRTDDEPAGCHDADGRGRTRTATSTGRDMAFGAPARTPDGTQP